MIAIGDEFRVRHGRQVNRFRREPDDAAPMFECERMQVTHLSCSDAGPGWAPYAFGVEPEWFVKRGLQASAVMCVLTHCDRCGADNEVTSPIDSRRMCGNCVAELAS